MKFGICSANRWAPQKEVEDWNGYLVPGCSMKFLLGLSCNV